VDKFLKRGKYKEAEQTLKELENMKKLRRKDKREKKKAEQILAERRNFLIQIGALGILGASGLTIGINGNKLNCNDSTTSNSNTSQSLPPRSPSVQRPSENITDSSVLIPENNRIQIPTYSFIEDETMEVNKPESLNMTTEEFARSSNQIFAKIRKIIEEFTIQERNNLQVFESFVSEIQKAVNSCDPRINEYFKKFAESNKNIDKKKYIRLLFEEINKFLRPAGIYIYVEYDQRLPKYNIYKINNTGQLRISDDQGTEEMQYVNLSSPLLPQGQRFNGAIASDTLQKVIIFESELKKIKGDFALSAGISPDAYDFDAFKKNTLRHEAAHLFIARRFPNTMEQRTQNFQYNVTVNVNGQNLVINSRVSVNQVQEICGLGSQLMHADSKNDLLAFSRIRPQPGYYIALKLIRLAILQVSNESPLISRVIHTMQSRGQFDLTAIHQLANSPDFTIEKVRRVGEILYRYGYNIFETIEHR